MCHWYRNHKISRTYSTSDVLTSFDKLDSKLNEKACLWLGSFHPLVRFRLLMKVSFYVCVCVNTFPYDLMFIYVYVKVHA